MQQDECYGRFWLAVQDLKKQPLQDVAKRVEEIWQEFLAPGAPSAINLDSHSYEITSQNVKDGGRYTFEDAQIFVCVCMCPKHIATYRGEESDGETPWVMERFHGGRVSPQSFASLALPSGAEGKLYMIWEVRACVTLGDLAVAVTDNVVVNSARKGMVNGGCIYPGMTQIKA
eukprot:bmy_03581T0